MNINSFEVLFLFCINDLRRLLKIYVVVFTVWKEKDISHNFNYANTTGKVTIDSNNNYYTIEDNILYNKDKTEICSVFYWIKGEFKVKDTVKIIGDYAFHYQGEMTNITLPEGITQINKSFKWCGGLTEIDIPSTVTQIDGECFAGCNNLSNINIKQAENAISGAPWGASKGMKVINWNR